MSRRAVDQALQAAQRERAGLWEAGAAVREALYGNAPQARERSMAALELSKDREVEYGAAFALALSGILRTRKHSLMTWSGGFLRIRQCDSVICLCFAPASN